MGWYDMGAHCCQWGAQLATPGAGGLAAWRWCRLGGTGRGAAQPCLHLPAPSRCLCASAHPPTPACTLTPPTRPCLHPDAACTFTLPTPAHPPSFPACSCPQGAPSQPVPPSLPGIPLPRATGQVTEMGIWHQPGTSPILSPPRWLGWLEGVWGQRGPWRGERGAGCLTAHSSWLLAPAAGAKPDWILNWKINLESCEPNPCPLPVLGKRLGTQLLPPPACLLLQVGKLRH